MWGALVLYVGKTTNELRRRATQHRTTHNHTTSKYIPDYMDWEIKLIEECTDEQGLIREQYWYDTLMPIYNYQRPGQSQDEYKRTGIAKEISKESSRRYRESHQELVNEKARKKYESQRELFNERRRQRYAAKKAANQ